MRLIEYLSVEKISERQFAALLKVSHVHVNNIIRGRKSLSLSLANKIEILTNGKVSMQELFNPDIPSKYKAKGNEEDLSVMGG